MLLAQDLRDAVLQAAIQGRLTMRLNTDSSVNELLECIKLEKKQLIKEKKIKNENLFPITEEDIPFELVDNWQWIRLGNIIKLLSGQDLTSDRYSDTKKEGLPYLTGASNFNKDGSLVFNRWTTSGTSIAQKNDLLITCKGTIGDMAYLTENAHIARQIMAISPIGQIKIDYIKIYLTYYINNLKAKAKSIIPGIDRKTILNLLISIPSIEEQQRIVDKVKELMAKIDEYEKMEKQLELLKKEFPGDLKNAILQAAMEGKLTKQVNNEIVDIELINNQKNRNLEECNINIPSNWEVGCIESISDSISTKNYQIKDKDINSKGKFPVVSQSKDYIIGYSNNSDKLLNISTPIVAFGDHTTVVKHIDFSFVVGADGLKIFKPNNVIDSRYLYYAMKYITIGLDKLGGYSRHYKFIKNKPIPIPPIEEQQRIIDKLDYLLPLCEDIEKMCL